MVSAIKAEAPVIENVYFLFVTIRNHSWNYKKNSCLPKIYFKALNVILFYKTTLQKAFIPFDWFHFEESKSLPLLHEVP